MRRWIELAVCLYPRKWQKRYGPEFRALLADVKPGWRELFNVLGGAIGMQLTNGAVYLKLGAGVAVIGALAAIAISFAVPRQYLSSATLRISPLPEDTATPERAFFWAKEDTLSRTSLSQIIQHPKLDLYKSERFHVPLEDVIAGMNRDIRISAVPSAASALVVNVQFTYTDQYKAQAVVNALITRMAESFAMRARVNGQMLGALRVRQNLEILDPPSLPADPIARNHAAFAAAGLAIGLLLGLTAALFIRHPRRTLILTSLGLAGCILGAGLSFLIPERYVSTAVIRIVPFDKLAGAEGAEWLRHAIESVTSRTSLAELIQRPELNLYAKERATTPLEDVIQHLRDRDLKFRFIDSAPVTGRSGTAVEISFVSQNRFKAQRMVHAITKKLVQQNQAALEAMHDPGRPTSTNRSGNIEYLDNASLPESPIFPNRSVIAALGFAAGLALGGLGLWIAQHRQSAALA